jgi:hypothetical protein
MKVSFELRREKISANGLIPIQFLVRADGQRLRKNIGIQFWKNIGTVVE